MRPLSTDLDRAVVIPIADERSMSYYGTNAGDLCRYQLRTDGHRGGRVNGTDRTVTDKRPGACVCYQSCGHVMHVLDSLSRYAIDGQKELLGTGSSLCVWLGLGRDCQEHPSLPGHTDASSAFVPADYYYFGLSLSVCGRVCRAGTSGIACPFVGRAV